MQDEISEIPVGSCNQMCPSAEFNNRKRQKRLNFFEMTLNKPIKEFSRSAAGKQINLEELRPASVLAETMNYLIDEVVDRKDQPWSAIYQFCFDRIRAIRQDMVIQRIVDETAVEILEKAVRFHILAHYKLKDASLESFDANLNDIHLLECLKRLLVLYDCNIVSQNRAEFEMYYLLYNLVSHEALQRILRQPVTIKDDGFVKLSLELSLMQLLGNFVAVFRMAAKLPFLGRCLVAKHSASLRCNAVAIMNTAFSSPNCKFPLLVFTKALAFEGESAAKEFVTSFGIEVDEHDIKFSKKSYVVPANSPNDGNCAFIVNVPCSIREVIQGNSTLQKKCLPDKDCTDASCMSQKIKHDKGPSTVDLSADNTNTQPTADLQVDSANSTCMKSTNKTSVSTPLRITVHNDYCRPSVPKPLGDRARGVKPCDADEINIKQTKGRGRGRGRGRARNV